MSSVVQSTFSIQFVYATTIPVAKVQIRSTSRDRLVDFAKTPSFRSCDGICCSSVIQTKNLTHCDCSSVQCDDSICAVQLLTFSL